jgi:hypothetical protein
VSRSLLNGTWYERAAAEDELFTCLDQRVAELVPAGDRVFIRSGVDQSEPGGSEFALSVQQRLTESVTARPAEPVLSSAGADLTLTVGVDDPGIGRAAPVCGTYSVRAVPG